MGRDHRTGLPDKLIPCPLGARHTSDSCQKSRCEYVSIPLRTKSRFITTNTGDDYLQKLWTKCFFLILLLMLLKLILFFCGGFCTYFFCS